jgi:hypothetical protein
MEDYYPDYDGASPGGLMGEHLIGENQTPADWDDDGVLGEDIFDEGDNS